MAEEAAPIDLDTFLPRVSKIVRPRVITIETGTTYQRVYANRPIILIAISPTTVGTIFASPVSQPLVDADAIPSTQGYIFLDAIGEWYVRHTSGANENFRIIDAGGAGNAPLAAASAGLVNDLTDIRSIGGTAQTAINYFGLWVARTMAAPTTVSVGVASASHIAASATRRFLYLRNTHATARVSFGFGAAAVLDSGVTLKPDEWVSFDATSGITTQEVFAIASGAATPVAVQTGT